MPFTSAPLWTGLEILTKNPRPELVPRLKSCSPATAGILPPVDHCPLSPWNFLRGAGPYLSKKCAQKPAWHLHENCLKSYPSHRNGYPTSYDLSYNLRWSFQVSEAFQSAHKISNSVLSVFSNRSKSALLTFCKSLFHVRNPSLIGEIKNLESTQRAFTLHISGCQDLSYWKRLKRLSLMSLQHYIIIFGLFPNDVGMRLLPHSHD